MTLSVPGAEDHPVLTLGQENRADLLRVIRTCGVSRVHLHHWIGFSDSPRHLIHELGLPFDFTVHDYYAICPQITLTSAEDRYCGEPDAAGCNRCLAEKPGHPATDIVSWRREHQWLFREADRVICPSEDVRRRLQRYGLSSRALVVPHERWREGAWPLRVPAAPTRRKRLRVGIIGAINQDKGQAVINACVPLARREGIEFFLIGHMKDEHACRIPYTGPYDEADLPGLIEAAQPHLLWFSAVWPETYSYTLSAALASGLPIIAPKIGAFTERLEKRPWSWLVDLAGATPETWIKTFLAVREALPSVPLVQSVLPVEEPGFYETDYLGDWAQPRRAGENLNAEVELSPT
jgi:glycosyltransferase involved in cell wall biosynthesis